MIGSAPIGSTPIAAALAPQVAAADASADRGLTAAFQTRAVRSRRHQQALWIASLAPAQQAAVVPVSAWMGRPVARRRSLKRSLLQVDPLQWQYIAPTIAAILPAAKVIKIEFRRKLQESAPLDYYPPPTGPPSEDWVTGATFETRRIRSRRFVKPQDVFGVGPASAPVIPYIETAAALKRRETTRKLQEVTHCPSYPATPPAVVPYLEAAAALKRKGTDRTHRQAAIAPVYPLAASQASLPAVLAPTRKRRNSRQGLFLSAGGDALSVSPAAPTTAAVYPSFVPVGYHRRSDTERRLQRALDAPVYPAAEVVTSNDRALDQAFQTRRIKSRRLARQPEVIGVDAATPVTPPAVYPALVQIKSKRRKSRQGLFLGGTPSVDGYVVPQPEPAWRLPKKHVANFRRKLRQPLVQPVFPATPPVPEQSEAAWRIKRAIWTTHKRRLLLQDVLLEHPETPFVPPPTGSSNGGGGGGGGRIVYPARRGKHAAKLLDEALNRVVAEVMYRDLLTAPEAPIAIRIVKPFSQIKRAAIPQPEAIDWNGVEKDVKRLEQLVKLYEQLQARRRRIAEDDEWLMMGD